MSQWGYDKVIKFVNLIRSYPVIWDPDDPLFRNQFQRELAYDELSFAMNTTNEVIKKKIHTLRSQYLAEYKKFKTSDYKPTWQYFNALKFIYKHEDLNFERPITLKECKGPHSNLDDESSNTQDSQDLIDIDEDDNATFNLSDAMDKPKTQTSAYESDENVEDSQTINDSSKKRRHLCDTNEIHSKSNKRTRNVVDVWYKDSPQIQDEFTIFGENIANELRLLKGHSKIQNALKLKIICAMKEAKFALHKARAKTEYSG